MTVAKACKDEIKVGKVVHHCTKARGHEEPHLAFWWEVHPWEPDLEVRCRFQLVWTIDERQEYVS